MPHISASRSAVLTRGVVVFAIGAIQACDITRVATPNVLTSQSVSSSQGAAALRAGALSEMATGLSTGALESGLLVDEFGTAPSEAAAYPEDQRVIAPSNTNYPFRALSIARIDGINAVTALKQYAPSPQWQIAEMYSLVATVEIMFGENECSGVPVANVTNYEPTYGPALTRDQLLGRAAVDLDSAASYAAGNDSIASLVAVLRGRVLLDQGLVDSAAKVSAPVPVTFAYPLTFSTTTASQLNQVYSNTGSRGRISVSDREGINGLSFVSANDPRVPTTTKNGANGLVYVPVNQNSSSAPVTLASGVEAQLMVAEAQLTAGQSAMWASTLNALRQQAISPAIAPLPDDSTVNAPRSEQLQVMFRERAFWLFATGHRHGDLRRLVRWYGLPVNSVFPTGLYEGGPQSYGTAVVFEPSGESPDSQYTGCSNLSA